MTAAIQLDRPMRAVTAPAANVVNAPIESRLSFIGNVNDMSPDSTCEENYEEGPITLAPQLFAVGRMPQALGLFGREPVVDADSKLLDALDAANVGRQIRTEEPEICSFAWSRSGSRRTALGVGRTCLAECFLAIRGGPPGPHNDDGVDPPRSGLPVTRSELCR